MVQPNDDEVSDIIGTDNPGHVTTALCLAYRETVFSRFDALEKLTESKLNGLRNQIIGALTLATAIIVLVQYLGLV